MTERPIPSNKEVYLQTLKDAVGAIYRDDGKPPRAGTMAWFDALENFNATHELAGTFTVGVTESIETILEATPQGLRKEYFSVIAPALSPDAVKKISARFKLGKI